MAETRKYTLIIAEKPDATRRIAIALDANGKPEMRRQSNVPYYVARRGKTVVVVPALGHLYAVVGEKTGRDHYPVFNFRWAPIYATRKNAAYARRWLEAISTLARDADDFIDACDYDVEGSIIGYNILKHACGGKETISKRMKYSTLAGEELRESFASPLRSLDFPLIEAGRTRHEVDWLYGINLSRAITMAVRSNSREYANLSTGRVQGPTLKFIAARDTTIKSFVPTPFWRIKAEIEIDGQIVEAQYEKSPIQAKRRALDILNAASKKSGKVENVETEEFQEKPLCPFDLGTLQRDAYSLFGYTPKQTGRIAELLYLDALISYPRTNSQKLPPKIDYPRILKGLSKIPKYRSLAIELLSKNKLKPREGEKEDSAHPAIYPTGKQPTKILNTVEKRILDLITKRFMVAFAEPTLIQMAKIRININEYLFNLEKQGILKEGWLRFYGPYAVAEKVRIPQAKEGQLVDIIKLTLEEKFTKPPPPYNLGSILKKMEEAKIGTKATRADIIQTLYDRKYVSDKRMTITDLGSEILKTLERYCPTIVSVRFTRQLEEKMNNIQNKLEKREVVLTEAVEILKSTLYELKKREETIGEKLSEATRKSRADERTVGACPNCKTGKLVILNSRRTGKRFIGCTNYFEGMCKTSFPLPQRRSIRPLAEPCHACGWPRIRVKINGRRSWSLCFNPKCPQKEKGDKQIGMQNM